MHVLTINCIQNTCPCVCKATGKCCKLISLKAKGENASFIIFWEKRETKDDTNIYWINDLEKSMNTICVKKKKLRVCNTVSHVSFLHFGLPQQCKFVIHQVHQSLDLTRP